MQNKLRDFFKEQNQLKMSTEHGLQTHNQMQFVDINSDSELAVRIKQNPRLAQMFDSYSRAEVPIAGSVNNVFISRRIDRLRIDNTNKTIDVLDFKTDIDKNFRRDHYKKQLSEYKILLRNIYSDYQINCWILWTHDRILESLN